MLGHNQLGRALLPLSIWTWASLYGSFRNLPVLFFPGQNCYSRSDKAGATMSTNP